MRQRVKTFLMWGVLIIMLVAALGGMNSVNSMRLRYQATPVLLPGIHASNTTAQMQAVRLSHHALNRAGRQIKISNLALMDSRLGQLQSPPTPTATPDTSFASDTSVYQQLQQAGQDFNAAPDTLPTDTGKLILISITNQWMYVYQDGAQIATTPITTGRPGLDTPIGTFHIFNKASPTTFVSMWPPGSPNYFAPTPINFALEFLNPGYFIHDSLWRNVYGPGSNTPHYVAGYGTESGSHGCVNVPYSTMSWLYNWADIGTTVQLTY